MPTSKQSEPLPRAVIQRHDTPPMQAVSLPEPLSLDDLFVLYDVLQDLANEIRRISREREKHR
jgi:hypothetical protein